MSIDCGSQITICDLPVRFDTYEGCSHACKYCFVKRKFNIQEIHKNDCVNSLKNFINGNRNKYTNWCDWDIPLHWGGTSDPFQPVEARHRISYNCLKLLAETKYPFIVSTKGRLIAETEYLELIKKCNAVVQVSMVCDKYDVMETGAPTYAERLEIVRKLRGNCRRVIVRIQPYMLEVFNDVIDNIPKLAQAGVYGITIEGMKFFRQKKDLVKVGGDFCYKELFLKHDFEIIRRKCHDSGMRFFCAENRLRSMGDSMTCCGIEGLGWKANCFNALHLISGENVFATPEMKKDGSGYVFRAIYQDSDMGEFVQNNTFENMMIYETQKIIRRNVAK